MQILTQWVWDGGAETACLTGFQEMLLLQVWPQILNSKYSQCPTLFHDMLISYPAFNHPLMVEV